MLHALTSQWTLLSTWSHYIDDVVPLNTDLFMSGQEETREAKAEMGGLCKRCEEDRRGGRLEEDQRQRRVEKTIR